MLRSLLLVCVASSADALSLGRASLALRRAGCPVASLAPAEPERVTVLPDASAVAAAVLERVEEAATAAIAERGHFALAIPGGSVLKMLAGSTPSWAAQTTLAYVNHKCVAMDDAALATHAKARAGFLDAGWAGVDAIVLSGSGDAGAEAKEYAAQLAALPADKLPRTADGLPCFDMAIIGVGDDGHVGSLYPDRDEVLATGEWVLAVEMKVPGSISLSLPVMASAKNVVIAACGVSEKYPKGKSAAMKRAIEGAEELQTFPAAGLRKAAAWIIDEAAASELSAPYQP